MIYVLQPDYFDTPFLIIFFSAKETHTCHWRRHQTSPTVVSLKGRRPQKV